MMRVCFMDLFLPCRALELVRRNTKLSRRCKTNGLEQRLDSYRDSSQHLGLPETDSLWLDGASLVGASNCAAATSAAFRINSSGIASNTVPPISTVRHSESPQTEQH